jgi:hypothetical protein
MLDKMPGLMAKSMAISQEKLKELAPRIEALVRESVTPPTPPAAKE